MVIIHKYWATDLVPIGVLVSPITEDMRWPGSNFVFSFRYMSTASSRSTNSPMPYFFTSSPSFNFFNLPVYSLGLTKPLYIRYLSIL